MLYNDVKSDAYNFGTTYAAEGADYEGLLNSTQYWAGQDNAAYGQDDGYGYDGGGGNGGYYGGEYGGDGGGGGEGYSYDDD
ncbi:hypothetical protein A0U93_00045 [Neoasaia chiangmaiensis]|uniref:Uncharacterized protein n=2 Tax=Neoasaia chiangmaiensis TaxID=320497 RepID=A0A1U9KLG6_9PROT|nr:hypothetical protein A0U93_00045 [Neoasaia chiangmaiensis]